jgi:hypothetical protein
MGALLTTPTTHVLLDQAFLVPEGRDFASHWAGKFINGNPAYRWVVGKYVEADRPNSNMQQWTLTDLESANTTIAHAPMNVMHRPQHIVGSFVGSEILYPIAGNDSAEDSTPHIEAVGAFWRYYFPTELAVVERAHNEGSLFFSMECVAETFTFFRPDGTSKSFPYVGATHPSYGEWGADPKNVRQLDKPHFLGGALIFPPKRPGWTDAKVQDMSDLVKDNSAEAEAAYMTFAERAPHLSPAVWEELMLGVLADAKRLTS